ncbi:MAG: 16S rRNA processing protein RimM [Desulfomonile tiedjei]|uniref:Ribosome maturation factor RimM n=1 Tax=Desulfomonile tiedjei TaxID=2358 RepID=A0A9D6VAS6_9BACT|nr:16S rRNA processing protein RimM [Desulfomonile tiedjei]
MTRNRLVVIGRAAKPFGIRGEIKVKPFTESLESFENSDVLVFGETAYKVTRIRIHKGAALVSLEGIDSPEAASKLMGTLVKTGEGNLPAKEEDEYYWFELLGMCVFTTDGRDLGKITQITPTGANDVLHVEGSYGEVLLPMIEDVVLEVDLENEKMTVDPLDGLIPDD